ncbi:DUF7281 domain-containing protein [Psychroflexus halocasei]|uniref:DUF7281 domain-containing protein n=1 Tax=Psychroflexus halocasei TaxID=908615 RepID=A0A1H4AXE0_9FLAO|nr:DUF2220 family protein [Psychroflexus halocasei]SEA40551.1 hypothetical protein SAMN05421540_105180 [Psychroflexus halocasei]
MKLTLRIAKILVQLIDGDSIPASSAKSKLIDELVFENILLRKGKHRKTIELLDETALHFYLANQLQINSIEDYISALENENSSRADFVKITSDSKDSKERVFKGFLINSYETIKATINHKEFIIQPQEGSFIFISDYENFKIPEEVTVIGVENAMNFNQIREQQYLFADLTPLFVSRYPQNQNKDFIKWINSIPNNYLHFGDFDLAGIGIYLNEYKKHLGEKASFFIPEQIDEFIRSHGNRKRFDLQKQNFKLKEIAEEELLALIEIIQQEQKGLDQEFFIGEI